MYCALLANMRLTRCSTTYTCDVSSCPVIGNYMDESEANFYSKTWFYIAVAAAAAYCCCFCILVYRSHADDGGRGSRHYGNYLVSPPRQNLSFVSEAPVPVSYPCSLSASNDPLHPNLRRIVCFIPKLAFFSLSMHDGFHWEKSMCLCEVDWLELINRGSPCSSVIQCRVIRDQVRQCTGCVSYIATVVLPLDTTDISAAVRRCCFVGNCALYVITPSLAKDGHVSFDCRGLVDHQVRDYHEWRGRSAAWWDGKGCWSKVAEGRE